MTRRRRPSVMLVGSGRGFGSVAPVFVIVAGGGLEEDNTGSGGSAGETSAAEVAAVAGLLRREAVLLPWTRDGGMEVIVVGGRIAGC